MLVSEAWDAVAAAAGLRSRGGVGLGRVRGVSTKAWDALVELAVIIASAGSRSSIDIVVVAGALELFSLGSETDSSQSTNNKGAHSGVSIDY